jgi:hypothetical protein
VYESFLLKQQHTGDNDTYILKVVVLNFLEPWNVRALSIRKTADLPLQLRVGTFPRFVAIGFYFLSETLIYSTVQRENAKSVSIH